MVVVETLIAQNVETAAQYKLRRPIGAYIELRSLRLQLKLSQTGHHFGQSSPHRKSLRIPGKLKITSPNKIKYFWRWTWGLRFSFFFAFVYRTGKMLHKVSNLCTYPVTNKLDEGTPHAEPNCHFWSTGRHFQAHTKPFSRHSEATTCFLGGFWAYTLGK